MITNFLHAGQLNAPFVHGMDDALGLAAPPHPLYTSNPVE